MKYSFSSKYLLVLLLFTSHLSFSQGNIEEGNVPEVIINTIEEACTKDLQSIHSSYGKLDAVASVEVNYYPGADVEIVVRADFEQVSYYNSTARLIHIPLAEIDDPSKFQITLTCFIFLETKFGRYQQNGASATFQLFSGKEEGKVLHNSIKGSNIWLMSEADLKRVGVMNPTEIQIWNNLSAFITIDRPEAKLHPRSTLKRFIEQQKSQLDNKSSETSNQTSSKSTSGTSGQDRQAQAYEQAEENFQSAVETADFYIQQNRERKLKGQQILRDQEEAAKRVRQSRAEAISILNREKYDFINHFETLLNNSRSVSDLSDLISRSNEGADIYFKLVVIRTYADMQRAFNNTGYKEGRMDTEFKYNADIEPLFLKVNPVTRDLAGYIERKLIEALNVWYDGDDSYWYVKYHFIAASTKEQLNNFLESVSPNHRYNTVKNTPVSYHKEFNNILRPYRMEHKSILTETDFTSSDYLAAVKRNQNVLKENPDMGQKFTVEVKEVINFYTKKAARIDPDNPELSGYMQFEQLIRDHGSPFAVVAAGKKDVLEEMIKYGLDVNLKSADGSSLVHTAVVNRKAYVLKLLLDNKASFKTPSGTTPLIILAAKKNYYEIVYLLMSKGANTNTPGKLSALHHAVYHNNVKMVQLLVMNGANANAKGEETGATPLHMAALRDAEGAAKVLCTYGADVNATTSNGRTPLHFAALENSYSVAKVLLSKGANVHLKDYEYQTTAYKAAKFKKHMELAKLIKQYK